MNEHDLSDELIMAGVQRRLAGVEPLVPLPPEWRPAAAGESGEPVRVRVRSDRGYGLGGLAALTLAIGLLVLTLGPLSQRNAGPIGPSASPPASGSSSPSSGPSDVPVPMPRPSGPERVNSVTISYQFLTGAGRNMTSTELEGAAAVVRLRLGAVFGTSDSASVVAQPPNGVAIFMPRDIPGPTAELVIPPPWDLDTLRDLLVATGHVEFVDLPAATYGTQREPGRAPVPAAGDTIDPLLPALLTGTDVDPAGVRFATDPGSGDTSVTFVFRPEAAKAFAAYTAANIDHYFAIVLDGRVFAAPYIKDAITKGSIVIEGGVAPVDAATLAAVLKSGPLPFPVTETQETINRLPETPPAGASTSPGASPARPAVVATPVPSAGPTTAGPDGLEPPDGSLRAASGGRFTFHSAYTFAALITYYNATYPGLVVQYSDADHATVTWNGTVAVLTADPGGGVMVVVGPQP